MTASPKDIEKAVAKVIGKADGDVLHTVLVEAEERFEGNGWSYDNNRKFAVVLEVRRFRQ